MRHIGRKIFITYGNQAYANSTLRLKKMAEGTGQFDEIIVYTEKDLPDFIIDHELMSYKKGGGYWLWKPYIIKKTLEECGENDIVIYSDAGNEVYNNDQQWNRLWSILKKHPAVFFKHGAHMENWARNNLIHFFQNKGLKTIDKEYQLLASFALFTKQALAIVNEWLDIMVTYPEFVKDVPNEQKEGEKKGFIENRHDQAVLSCVVYEHLKNKGLAVLWQHSEYRDPDGQTVYNARISDDRRRSSNKFEPRYCIFLRTLNNCLRDIRISIIRFFA